MFVNIAAAYLTNKQQQMNGIFLSTVPPNFAECQPYVGELLLEGLVHVLLEVRGFDVFDDRRLKRETRGGVRETKLSAPRASLRMAPGSSHLSVKIPPSHSEVLVNTGDNQNKVHLTSS